MEDPKDEALVEQETASTGFPFLDSISSASSGIIPIFQSHLPTGPRLSLRKSDRSTHGAGDNLS
jgi:hypothetical protein